MASAREWMEGARLRTLPASVSPVLAGSLAAWFTSRYNTGPRLDDFMALLVLFLCLIVGVGFQVGCNFANDYSDGVRGTDQNRTGPMRLVGSGATQPQSVKRAAWISFAVACLAGFLLVVPPMFNSEPGELAVSIVLILVGIACVLAAWFYTGGKRPYGYVGLGEISVFIFFGLVATIGTAVIQTRQICVSCSCPPPSIGCPTCIDYIAWVPIVVTAIVMGCFATAILVANNLRDLSSDACAGKRTFAVRIGANRTRVFYVGLVGVAGIGVVILGWLTSWFVLIGLAGLALLIPSIRRVVAGGVGAELVGVLKWTGLAELATAVLLGLGWGIGWLSD